MRKRFASMLAGVIFSFLAGGWANAMPEDFSFDDINYWVGEGENEAALVIDWNDAKAPQSLVWGYRWSDTATGEDMLNNPQLQHRQFFKLLPHTEMGDFHYDSHAFKLSRTPAELRAFPRLGEHTEYVLKELLGYSEEEYVNLLLAGALE